MEKHLYHFYITSDFVYDPNQQHLIMTHEEMLAKVMEIVKQPRIRALYVSKDAFPSNVKILTYYRGE